MRTFGILEALTSELSIMGVTEKALPELIKTSPLEIVLLSSGFFA